MRAEFTESKINAGLQHLSPVYFNHRATQVLRVSSKFELAIRPLIFALIIFSVWIAGCGGKSSSPDFKFIDSYLTTWDRFAQGASDLAPHLKRDTPQFHKELAAALKQDDKRAPSRLVFYAVVQVGGFIDYDSDLGRACQRLVGSEVPIFTSENGQRSYFAGDLYFWWQRHRAEFESFPLYEEWSRREFARKTVIPMYESAAKNQ